MAPSILLSFGLLSYACIPNPNNRAGAAYGSHTPDGLTCGQRLVGGAWHMVKFTPDQPLAPATATSLERLHGSLRLQFDGQRAITTGPGLYHVGPYRVQNDDGLGCQVLAPDDSGTDTSTAWARFLDPNHIEVLDRQSAVPGRAVFERSP